MVLVHSLGALPAYLHPLQAFCVGVTNFVSNLSNLYPQRSIESDCGKIPIQIFLCHIDVERAFVTLWNSFDGSQPSQIDPKPTEACRIITGQWWDKIWPKAAEVAESDPKWPNGA